MKKKLFAAVFVLAIAFVLTLTASAAKFTELTTSGDNYGFEFAIKGNTMNISGRVQNEKVFYIAVSINDSYSIINVSPDVKFSSDVKLPEGNVKKLDVGIYLGEKISSSFTSLFFDGDITIEKLDGKWYFTVNDEVYKNNTKWLSGWMDASAILNTKQPSAVKMVISSVIKDVKGNYAKAEAIHHWVADNIYYDKDYALGEKNVTSLTPVEVLTSRVSVCEGYANLTASMLNAAGIPAVTVKGYSLGVSEYTEWSQVPKNVEANHMWVEAYVDGRWIIMDPTWDSKNMYYRGKKEKELAISYRYFDISPEMLSAKHKIIDRPNVFGENGVSSWAFDEVMAAHSNKLIVPDIYTTMKDKITREEFCDLVVNLLTVKFGKTMEQILEERKLELNYDFFHDTYDYNILAANALGIVNGKENNLFDPNGYITRQEAAVMLQRTAKVMGANKANDSKVTFADAKIFPSWSAAAIDFVSASLSRSGKRVMGGVENNNFDPKGYYTKEQSVLTVYRLFDTY